MLLRQHPAVLYLNITITEAVTGIDIVQAQILISEGANLHQDIKIPLQADMPLLGSAIQCRITTEDPENNFLPDTGIIDTYRSPGGFGVRLDVGNAYSGYEVTPYFDSLLVKVITQATDFSASILKMDRCLREFRIRGVKTNIPFLRNVLNHPEFVAGNAKTTFIDSTTELYNFPRLRDRGNKTMKYVANITVNGFPGISKVSKPYFDETRYPKVKKIETLTTKNILDTQGADAVVDYVNSRSLARNGQSHLDLGSENQKAGASCWGG